MITLTSYTTPKGNTLEVTRHGDDFQLTSKFIDGSSKVVTVSAGQLRQLDSKTPVRVELPRLVMRQDLYKYSGDWRRKRYVRLHFLGAGSDLCIVTLRELMRATVGA